MQSIRCRNLPSFSASGTSRVLWDPTKWNSEPRQMQVDPMSNYVTCNRRVINRCTFSGNTEAGNTFLANMQSCWENMDRAAKESFSKFETGLGHSVTDDRSIENWEQQPQQSQWLSCQWVKTELFPIKRKKGCWESSWKWNNKKKRGSAVDCWASGPLNQFYF